jgi:hypothetical protein
MGDVQTTNYLDAPTTTVARIRQWLLALLLLELGGTLTELLLLQHFEGVLQWIPLVLLTLTVVVVLWHLARPQPASVSALRGLMVCMAIAGLAGVVLHLRSSAEYLMEMDPSQSRWTIVMKALQAQAPPALAPGVLLQMGLLGLVYVYRYSPMESEQ